MADDLRQKVGPVKNKLYEWIKKEMTETLGGRLRDFFSSEEKNSVWGILQDFFTHGSATTKTVVSDAAKNGLYVTILNNIEDWCQCARSMLLDSIMRTYVAEKKNFVRRNSKLFRSRDVGSSFAKAVGICVKDPTLYINLRDNPIVLLANWTHKEDFLLLNYYHQHPKTEGATISRIEASPQQLWLSLPEFMKSTKPIEKCLERLETLIAMVSKKKKNFPLSRVTGWVFF